MFWKHTEHTVYSESVRAVRKMSMKIILNMHNKFVGLPNDRPFASVRSRTAIEHTECFPNMIRSLPEHSNSYSESKRNGIRPNVIGS